MKLYLAAPWIYKDNMPAIASQFEAADHEITWKWWEAGDIAGGDDRDAETRNLVDDLKAHALDDFWGAYSCDTLIVINSSKSEGKAVEQGIALALDLPIIAIGKRGECSLNVFHYMDNYTWVPTIEEAIKCLQT